MICAIRPTVIFGAARNSSSTCDMSEVLPGDALG
jgi:hypothetical protein